MELLTIQAGPLLPPLPKKTLNLIHNNIILSIYTLQDMAYFNYRNWVNAPMLSMELYCLIKPLIYVHIRRRTFFSIIFFSVNKQNICPVGINLQCKMFYNFCRSFRHGTTIAKGTTSIHTNKINLYFFP